MGGLNESVLCVQGPPGTGKTYTAARAIAALVAAGRRVGVTSNSRKAILNLLGACADVPGTRFRCLKIGSSDDPDDAAFAAARPGAELIDSAKAALRLPAHHLVGGTAWYFSRLDAVDTLDVLFVDEAGQVSLANLVGMAPSAKSLVLLGDPMQLSQPTQGTHPGDSGCSALDYALTDHATVPPEFGVFLPTTRRLHPDLCTFISGAFYEDRLRPELGTDKRVVHCPKGSGIGGAAGAGAGARHVPLEAGLPGGARIGSVDRFQGQEARVAIVSLTASDAETAGRGLEFVLDRRRLNVAISRAQLLAIVVESPSLARARCGTIGQMRLLNTLCRIEGLGRASTAGG